MTPAQSQLQPENTNSSALRGRRAKTLAGIALAVPTSIAGIGLAGPASAAAPAQADPHPAPATSAPSAGTTAPTGVSVKRTGSSSNVTVVRYGDTGSLVKTVQDRLNISKDGSFGPKTLAAVKAFQGKKGLAKDGVVGPKTWGALGGFPGGGSGDGGGSTGGGDNDGGGDSTTNSSKAGQIAAKYIGTPYKYGGSTPSEGFDCSGLTSYVFNQLGKSLPRSARAQQAAVTRVSSPQPGDLVFYGYPAHHVGIYIGGGKMIDAPKPGMTVQKRDVYQPEVSSYGRV